MRMTRIQRLIIALWWLLWPLSALVSARAAWAVSDVKIDAPNFVGMLIVGMVFYSYKLTTESYRSFILERATTRPFRALLDWTLLLLLPLSVSFAALVVRNATAEAAPILIAMLFTVAAYVFAIALLWVVDGR